MHSNIIFIRWTENGSNTIQDGKRMNRKETEREKLWLLTACFATFQASFAKAPKTIINSDRIRFRRLIKSTNLAKDCVIYEITVVGSTQIELEKIDERKEKIEGERELEWE